MRPLPGRLPDTDRRAVVRVPQQPYLRVDRNDYSVDPRFAGRRVELRVSQTEVTAVVYVSGFNRIVLVRGSVLHFYFDVSVEKE